MANVYLKSLRLNVFTVLFLYTYNIHTDMHVENVYANTVSGCIFFADRNENKFKIYGVYVVSLLSYIV